MADIKVRRMTEFRSKRWGIYRDGVLVEGGFFGKPTQGEAERKHGREACSHCGGQHARESCSLRFGGPNFNAVSNPDGV